MRSLLRSIVVTGVAAVALVVPVAVASAAPAAVSAPAAPALPTGGIDFLGIYDSVPACHNAGQYIVSTGLYYDYVCFAEGPTFVTLYAGYN